MEHQDYRPVIDPLTIVALEIIAKSIRRQPGHPRPEIFQLIDRAIEDFIDQWKARDSGLKEEIEGVLAALRPAKEAVARKRGRPRKKVSGSI